MYMVSVGAVRRRAGPARLVALLAALWIKPLRRVNIPGGHYS